MIKLLIENLSEIKIPARLRLNFFLKKTLQSLRKTSLNGRIEVFFVDEKLIKSLNKDYRGQDKVTDVLSFSFLEGESFPGDDLVGQIFIAPKIAQKQGEERGLNWREEVEFLMVHALLHIFGYDHEDAVSFKKMFALQAKIMPGQKWEHSIQQIYRESFD